MAKNPRVGVWFLASATIFFTRALIFSTWLSRGPEVKAALQLDTAQMGILSMLWPAGGLMGIFFASSLANRFGSTKMTIVGFSVTTASLVGLGYSIDGGNALMSGLCLILMGLPMALADFVGNYEATSVDKSSRRSLVPAIHAAFGVGMMAAATFSSALIAAGASIQTNYTIVAVIALVPSVWAGLMYPRRASEHQTVEARRAHSKAMRTAWTEPRTLTLAFIGFSFILIESSAGTWVPISLANSGQSQAAAAGALGFFWLVVTLGRAVGGFATDRFGRPNTLRWGALMTVVGIAIFMLNPVMDLPYLGLALWALGMANGFPLAISALSDDPVGSAARINLFVTVVYIAVISVGPLLGSVGQLFGLGVAFGIPLAASLASAWLSKITRPLKLGN